MLECPHCNGSLYIQGANLIPSYKHKVNPEEINKYEEILQKLYRNKSRYQEKNNLDKQIKSMKGLITSDKQFNLDDIVLEKNKLMTRLRELEKIEITLFKSSPL